MNTRSGRWAYRLLLRLLPAEFRAVHGREMEELFDDALADHGRRGGMAWLLAWLRGGADVVEQALRLRSARSSGGSHPLWRGKMEALFQDVRFAARSLLKSPGFATVATLTLALGIGANTAIFSLVNAVLLRAPSHVEDPGELVSIWTSDYSGPRYGTSSYLDYEDFRDLTPALEDAAIVSPGVVNLAGEAGASQIVVTEFVSGNYFEMLGVRPALGRWFTAEEGDWASGAAVAVVSHGMWTRSYGQDPAAVGATVRLSGQTVTIVGVAPEGFLGSLPVVTPDFWIPVSTQALIQGTATFDGRGNRGSLVKARLADGASLELAQSQLDGVAVQLQEQYPRQWTDVRDERRKVTVTWDARIPPQMQSAVGGFAVLLLSAVGVVLLIACANVANLTLARASRRNRELAIRLALGSGRRRLMRQLLSESAILGVLGGLGGTALAYAAVRFAESYRPATGVALSLDLGVDRWVLLFSVLATVTTVLAVGLTPAIRASRPDLVPALKEGAETAGRRFRWFHLRNLLVITQVSASLVLLVGAGLFLKGLQAAMELDAGFEPDGVATVALNLGREGYSVEEAELFFDRLAQRVEGFSGVESVTRVDALPLTLMAGRRVGISVPGYEPRDGEDMEFQFFSVGPGYFEVIQNHLLAGREFTEQDVAEAPLTVVVNETFAQKFWPGEDPIGRLVNWNGQADAQVVGLAADASYRSLNEEPRAAFFIPLEQNPSAAQTLIARTAPDFDDDLLGALRTEVVAMGPRLPISSLQTMEETIAGTLLPQRVASWLLSIAGLLGLLLASMGLYGVISFLVAQRTREVGVRMALGAHAADVIMLVVGRGLVLAGVGAVFGLALAAGVTRFLQSLLFGVSPLDPSVFAMMGLVALAVAGIASYVPARRAATVDPAVTLREE